MARLARIWAEILDTHRASAAGELQPHLLDGTINGLQLKLDAWVAALPAFLSESQANLDHCTSVGLGTAFTALHLGYHYYN